MQPLLGRKVSPCYICWKVSLIWVWWHSSTITQYISSLHSSYHPDLIIASWKECFYSHCSLYEKVFLLIYIGWTTIYLHIWGCARSEHWFRSFTLISGALWTGFFCLLCSWWFILLIISLLTVGYKQIKDRMK